MSSPALRRFSLAALATLSGAALLALSSAGCTPAPTTLKKIGDACTVDGDCGKMLCSKTDQVCTRPCLAQTDCPSGFDCGLAHPEDGKAGAVGATCYKSKVENPASGGFGADCAAYSPDPNNPDAPCNDMVKNPCATGFSCRGQVKCDGGAYCTKACASDGDCPPSMMCAITTAATACKTDGDCVNGFTCKPSGAPGGKGKVCTGGSWCRKREQCSACATDDQCPAGYSCAKDAAGERYCGRQCTEDNQCPTPAPSTTGYFYKCVDGNNGKTVCQPLQGACHGTSNVTGVAAGGACAWCRDGVPSDCPDSFCFALTSAEHFCAGLCTVRYAGKFDFKTDTCPDGLFCLVPRIPSDCGAGCDAPGWCVADPKRQQLTCYAP